MTASLDVLFADNHLLVVSKPAGVPTVPDASGDVSLLDMARAWIEREHDKPGRAFVGVVHRIDRPVSGVVCFARTSKAASRLTAAFKERRVDKTYLAVGAGSPRRARGVVEQWISKDRRTGAVRAAAHETERAQRAVTAYEVLARGTFHGRPVALLRFEPETGRPHQIRLAARSLGLPLLGDLRHGAGEPLPDRSVALHAWKLALDHPTKKERTEWKCPPPRSPWWRAFPLPE
ncbi:MAG: RluA family pseudouridine synthase [Planctomycetota bacterium]